ncbi:MAG: FG-GAP-like repeat-containing protein, partial [Chitinophagales bacterium]
TLSGLSSGDNFGISVSSAGDVNGDGYGDVIVGAHEASSFKGAAYIFLGSSSGISSSASTTLSGVNNNDYFGVSVACAGDINGDGYSDVIAGAYQAPSGAGSGAAYVFLGSSSGVSSSPSTTINGASGGLGLSVNGAGDINADGFSDMIIGAPGFSSSQGAVYFYYGNGISGFRNNLRLYNSDLVTPIQQSNMADPNLFGAGLFAKSFLGRQTGKLVWETVWNGQPFTGTPIANSVAVTGSQSSFLDLNISGAELKSQIAKRVARKATYIRARVKYNLVTAITGQVYGPWRYPEGFLRGRRDIGSVALPVQFISFTAVKQDKFALLKWKTSNEDAGLNYEVQRSTDGIHFSLLAVVPAANQPINEYQYTDLNPAVGKNYYRISAVGPAKEIFTETRQLTFAKENIFTVYPNPVQQGDELIISSSNPDYQILKIELFNTSGQLVLQENINSSVTAKILIPDLVSGQYFLIVTDKKENRYSEKVLVIKK